MIFLLFLKNSLHEFKASNKPIQLDYLKYQQVFSNSIYNSYWLIFYYKNQLEFTTYFEMLNDLATDLNGISYVGFININELDQIQDYSTLQKTPCFKLCFPSHNKSFFGNKSVQLIESFVFKNLPNSVKFIQSLKNFSMKNYNSFVIFLDTSPWISKDLIGTSYLFRNRPIDFFYSSSQELFDKFKLSVFPTIIMSKSDRNYTIRNISSFSSFKEKLITFFHHVNLTNIINDNSTEAIKNQANLKSSPSKNTIISASKIKRHEIDEFHQICHKTKKLCLLIIDEIENSVYYSYLKLIGLRKVILLSGINPPYKFMKKGEKWIYHPHKDVFYKFDNKSDLQSVLDNITDGGNNFPYFKPQKEL